MPKCYGIISLFLLVMLASPARAQNNVRINWTAVTGAQSGMFMAQQEGLFKKNGLNVELIHIPSSSRAREGEFLQAICRQVSLSLASRPANKRGETI